MEITIRREHGFRKKPKTEDGKRQVGCAKCGRAKLHACHLGLPPSLNGAIAMDRRVYGALKDAWQRAMHVELEASGLPRDLDRVSVEVLVGFPTQHERDEGNIRWMLEKALGDTLVDGGWLSDDSFWPTMRYSMGNLQGVHTPDESWVRFLIAGQLPGMA